MDTDGTGLFIVTAEATVDASGGRGRAGGAGEGALLVLTETGLCEFLIAELFAGKVF